MNKVLTIKQSREQVIIRLFDEKRILSVAYDNKSFTNKEEFLTHINK